MPISGSYPGSVNTGSGSAHKLYHNTGWGFEDQTHQIPGLVGYAYGDVAWADFDNNGWLDLIVSGKRSDGTPGTQIFRNTGNGSLIYTTLISNLIQVVNSKIACPDFNRDGRPDLLITGEPSTSGVRLIRLYASSLDGYIGASASIPNLPGGNQGQTGTQSVSRLYQNLSPLANTPPTPPGSLTSQLQAGGTRVVLNWQAGDDAQTPPAGLSYNLYVSETPREQSAIDQKNIVSPVAQLETGRRRVVQLGNSQGTSYTLTGLEPGKTYYWGVQAIDGAFAGSPFSAEQSFTTSLLSSVAQPLQLVAPLYNCQTGAFTFQTTGGDGSLIEYMAPGITS